MEMAGQKFPCVDEGFGKNEAVDVVVRPEDIMVVGQDVGMLDRHGGIRDVQGRALRNDDCWPAAMRWKVHSTGHAARGQRGGPVHRAV